MCMITFLPPHVKVPMAGIANGGTWNDDGHGWAIAAGPGHMLVGKSMDLEVALEDFRRMREDYPAAPALFHSRWATHGVKDVSNVHPFYVAGKQHAGNVVVAHNGVLPATFHPKGKDTRSDTRIMADEWLGVQTKGTWTRKERKRIGNLIGIGNKLAILSVDPALDRPKGYLVNADRGEWSKGAWFSNGDYQYSWVRGRYAGSRGTGWQSSSIGITRDNSMFNSERAYESRYSWMDDECPFCFSTGHIDHGAGVCTFCNTCLDCFEPLVECYCFTPANRDKDTMNAVCLKCGESALGDCDCEDIVSGASDKENAIKAVERYMNSDVPKTVAKVTEGWSESTGGWYSS